MTSRFFANAVKMQKSVHAFKKCYLATESIFLLIKHFKFFLFFFFLCFNVFRIEFSQEWVYLETIQVCVIIKQAKSKKKSFNIFRKSVFCSNVGLVIKFGHSDIFGKNKSKQTFFAENILLNFVGFLQTYILNSFKQILLFISTSFYLEVV